METPATSSRHPLPSLASSATLCSTSIAQCCSHSLAQPCMEIKVRAAAIAGGDRVDGGGDGGGDGE